jgi:hypothetical protein
LDDDLDLGEMFLNVKLHVDIRLCYAGVDLTTYGVNDASSGRDSETVFYERWERCLMGLKPSPYNTTRAFAMCEEVIRAILYDGIAFD